MNGRRNAEKPEAAASERKSAVEEPIVAAAAELFRERGFAGTSMQNMAEAAGLSRPALPSVSALRR